MRRLRRWGFAAAVVAMLSPACSAVSVSESRSVVTTDRADDCRVPRRDFGDRCDEGADVESVRIQLDRDRDRLRVDVKLSQPPQLEAGAAWTVQFYAELVQPAICGLSNVLVPEGGTDDGSASAAAEPRPYALDPDTKADLAPERCGGRLEGSSAVFDLDVADQGAEPFRLIGSVKLEFPDDPARPGSEDDFLVSGSLLALRA